jgi:hypothetical protein
MGSAINPTDEIRSLGSCVGTRWITVSRRFPG